jgi:acid phosphatase (class A)
MSSILRPLRLAVFLLLLLPVVRPALAGEHYVTTATVDLAPLLAPPPAAGSAEERAELDIVLATSRGRSPAEAAAAQADSATTVFRFSDVLGPGFTEENLPFATGFFAEIAGDTHAIVAAAKISFDRYRPYAVDGRIPALTKDEDTHKRSGSYPSGHSSFAYATAVVLAAMLPEKAPEIFARAADFAHNRLVAGVHYPTDIEAGRISGTVIANALLHDPRFQKDFAKARAEVRRAAGVS